MILVGHYDSAVTRRVAIALHHYGLPFTRNTGSLFADAAEIGRINPLTRIPALILEDGEVLIDSAAILDHLDQIAGDRALIARSGPQRREVLQVTALAMGTFEKAVHVLYERHFHPEGHQSADWISRCLGQARGGLDALTARLRGPFACGATLSHADVMITTMLWYMNDRMADALSPKDHAPLLALAERCEALPAFRAAALSEFERMPRR